MKRPLDQRDRAILRALKASNLCHSRDSIAAMLDKTKLHPEDQIALDCLASDGRVERSRTGGAK